ncbi:MAG TPA: amylo-alpha-1,6-glucosidase [Oxalicibacterium sp.]|nr:amylo-alpha-1,6-glucosidase [Oxalicibacterium sp.]
MLDKPIRSMPWAGQPASHNTVLLTREWLVANALGGYASGTVSGIVTRRYHGLLVAALPAPLGRTVMLSHVTELVHLPEGVIELEPLDQHMQASAQSHLSEFRLEMGLPVWRYQIGDLVLEKSVLMPHQQNTVHLTYKLIQSATPVCIELRPAMHFRPIEAAVDQVFVEVEDYSLMVNNDCYVLHGGGFPQLAMKMLDTHASFTVNSRRRKDVLFLLEKERGYPSIGEHWSPGYFTLTLEPGQQATLLASTEAADTLASLTPAQARTAEVARRRHLLDIAGPQTQSGMAAELVLAADQFIITPAGRAEETARERAIGHEVKTVIAGYHWFTDWGRDTMISLEGLTLMTGRHDEARAILRTFANYVRDGLIPNMFPEHGKTGLYHTADATLWFFHALHRYLQATNDRDTLRTILPKLNDIVEHHLRGTLFNIGVDRQDGLLKQGQEGYQLTWMDAKVDGWVVTPRRGKAVELNALWYNALRLLENWLREEQDESAAQSVCEHAERARRSFNQRFWYAEGGYLYDVVDGEHGGDDAACRPNQLFAISLEHPVLDRKHWQPVLDVVQKKLLTPVGLRSLSPDHPDYKQVYAGDLPTRDAAYHQGTVWGWLIGPYIDAWLKLHPQDGASVDRLLDGFEAHLGEAGLGTISEIFDAQEPYTPRGCIAQAWSVAEVLRCRVKCAACTV